MHTVKWLYIHDLLVNSLLVILFSNELELIYLHTIKYYYCFYTVKWFQVFSSNVNNSIESKSFLCRERNDFKYCFLTLIIYLHSVKWLQALRCDTNNLIFAVSSIVSSIPIKHKKIYQILIICLYTLKPAHWHNCKSVRQ